jgi:hypothetical protein
MKRTFASSFQPSYGLLGCAAAALLAAAIGACSAGDASGAGSSGSGGSSSATTDTTGSGGATTATTAAGQGGDTINGVAVGAGGGACNPGGPDDDADDDGFTEAEGDCNDCDKFVNPDAIEVIAEPDDMGNTPEPADEDCNGTIDVLDPPCDGALVLDSSDPMDAAKAIGACRNVVAAAWVVADGTPPPASEPAATNYHLGHGIMSDFGANNPPQEGTQLLVMSSGTARRKTDPGFVHRNFDKGYSSNPPFGFPQESESCPDVTTGLPHDAAGLELTFKAPSNAQGISFDFSFFTYEWPRFICTKFNDFFVAIMSPIPDGQTDGNISFDTGHNPVSVNNSFLDFCKCPAGAPCSAPPSNPVKSFDCTFGTTALEGTDFASDDNSPGWSNGTTGWLRTSAPVDPGQTFSIRFTTYDSDDGLVDSTTLIDNWQWSAKPGTVETIIPD